jgi:hypothetical protein
LQKVTEMMQAGILDPSEGRRLLDYPDISQVDKLAKAAEERIYKILDAIVENGDYTPPDPFIDIQLAMKTVVQYYNLYQANELEESKLSMLRDWKSQLETLQQEAIPPQPQGAPGQPQAVPQANPTSDLMSQVPNKQ